MTIHIPKPVAILLAIAFLAPPLILFLGELPDLIRYLKQVEGL